MTVKPDRLRLAGESAPTEDVNQPLVKNLQHDEPGALSASSNNHALGLGACLHDAVALARQRGPGVRIGIGQAGTAGILAPAGLALHPSEAAAAVKTGRRRYLFSFGNHQAADIAGIAPVIDTLCAATGTGFMAACLAAPWAGRTMYQGHLFAAGRLQGDVPRAFAMALEGSAGLVAHEIVAAGAAAIRRQCGVLKEQGKVLALIDAINDDDCTAIAAALADQPLIGGGAWLWPRQAGAAPAPPEGKVAILSGALDRQTIFQVGAARAAMPVFELDFSVPNPAARALAWARPNMGAPFIISSSVPPDKITPGAPAAETLALIAKSLVAAGITRLVVAGNDTASAVINALGIQQLDSGALFGPLQWLRHEEISICVKPGGIGGKNLFLHEFEPQIRLNEPAE